MVSEEYVREVRIRLSFKRILNISIIDQSFTAEIFFEASWEEPDLSNIHGAEADNSITYDFPVRKFYITADRDMRLEDRKGFFTPHLCITNIKDRKHEIDTENWFQIYYPEKNKPIVCQRVKVTATFQERMELEKFPFDEQELGINIAAYCPYHTINSDDDYKENRVKLVKNMNTQYKSVVIKHNFVQENEYDLMDLIRFTEATTHPNDSATNKQYSTLRFACVARRLKSFWVYNVVLPLFLLTAICAGAFSVPANDISSRVGITLAIILSTVAFKFLISDKLPSISYLTIIDIYVLICLIVQTGISLESIIYAASVYSGNDSTEHFEFGSPAPLVTYFLVTWTALHVAILGLLHFHESQAAERDYANPVNDRHVFLKYPGNELEKSKLIENLTILYELVDRYRKKRENSTGSSPPKQKSITKKRLNMLKKQRSSFFNSTTIGDTCWSYIHKGKFEFQTWTRTTANNYIEKHFVSIMAKMNQDVIHEDRQILRERGDYPFMRGEKESKKTFYVLTFHSKEMADEFISEIHDIKETFNELWKDDEFRKGFCEKFEDIVQDYHHKNQSASLEVPSCLSLETDQVDSGVTPKLDIVAELLMPELRFLGTSLLP